MHVIRKLGVAQKLGILTGAILLVIGVFVFLFFPIRQHDDMMGNLRDKSGVISQIVAQGVGTALLFDDASSAQSALEVLPQLQGITFGGVLRSDGTLFVAYQEERAKSRLAALTGLAGADSLIVREEAGEIVAVAPVRNGRTRVGTVVLGTSTRQIDEATTTNRWVAFLVSCVIFAAGFALTWVTVRRWIAQPIAEVVGAAERLAIGDTAVNLQIRTQDELGRLAGAVNTMARNLTDQAMIAERIAAGDLGVEPQQRSTRDILGSAVRNVHATLVAVNAEMKELTGAAVLGRLTSRGRADQFSGAYREIVQGVNATLDAVIKPVQEGSAVLTRMATGDLTARLEGDYHGDHRLIKESINTVGTSLADALRQVSEVVSATAGASSQISASTEQMAAGAQEQTHQAGEVARAVEEMAKTIQENSKNAATTSDVARKAKHAAQDGEGIIKETARTIQEVVTSATTTGSLVETLDHSSHQIGTIIQVIDDIADQTNLLALNAAIEAARAGDQGRGFAVVADEVRKLAEKTTTATKEIAGLITTIQQDTRAALASMVTAKEVVGKGMQKTRESGEALMRIVALTSEAVDRVMHIAAASEEQSRSSEQISRNVEGITKVTGETAQGTQQIARAAEDLNRLTQNLELLIGRFTLGGEERVGRSAGAGRHVARTDQNSVVGHHAAVSA